MGKNKKPNVGSTKKELNNYIELLESNSFKKAQKNENLKKINVLEQRIEELEQRIEELESKFNVMTEDVSCWENDLNQHF